MSKVSGPKIFLAGSKGLPLSLMLLSALCLDLSCSKPPALLDMKGSADAKGETVVPEVDTDDGSPGDKDEPETGTDPETNIPVSQPDKVDPPIDPVVETPKFVPCTDQSEKCHPHVFILADEPLRKILLVNLDDPSKDWDLDIPFGVRDLQLIGDGKLLVGTLDNGGGYHEVNIATGKILKSVVGFGAVGAVQRLANGNTLVMGENLNGESNSTVVLETDSTKKIINKYVFKGVTGGRMVRRTLAGTFLVGKAGAGQKDFMLEMTKDGKEIWRAENNDWPAHMALRQPSGETIVASGHGKTLLFFDKNAKLKKTIGGPSTPEANDVKPNYSGAFFMMPNGNFIMTNWQGHEKNLGASGRQIIEYNA
ncbi:MAG: hypothetical protein EOP07_12720, partial [Proteobacteria bacterium]